MHSYYTFIAMEIARERLQDADRDRFAALARSAEDASDRPFRPFNEYLHLARFGDGWLVVNAVYRRRVT